MRLAGIGTDRTLDEVYKFVPPVFAGPGGARWAGVEIDLARINLPTTLNQRLADCRRRAGGVLVPINPKQFMLGYDGEV